MTLQIKIDDSLFKALDKANLASGIKREVTRSGANLQREMMRKATFKGHYNGGRFIRPTGATKRSITLIKKDGGYTVVVKPETEYSPFLEYGTRYMSSQPFVRPSFLKQKPYFLEGIYKLMK